MAPDFADERLFMLDLVDAARHLVSLRIDALLQASVAAYRRGDAAAGDRAQRAMRDLVLGVDAMLGVQPDSLSTWIDDARRYADTPDEARANVTNAKAQITIWGGGGGLDDYASKAWQGLYRHYYLPRWSRFLRALRAAGTGPFDEARAWHGLAAWEQAWVAADTPYRRAAPSNPIATVRSVIAGLGRG
jgi:alpha-N-acetylglucosaminidase